MGSVFKFPAVALWYLRFRETPVMKLRCRRVFGFQGLELGQLLRGHMCSIEMLLMFEYLHIFGPFHVVWGLSGDECRVLQQTMCSAVDASEGSISRVGI